MTDKPLFNRRFIRLQAVQQLYAFYIGKQANYDWARDQIQADFIPDVFADPAPDTAQPTQEAQQAIDLFNASLTTPETPPPSLAYASSQVNTAVSRALTSYKNELALTKAIATMHQACIRIWQLLVEWLHIAQKQAERPKLTHPHSITSSPCLADSYLLQRLQNDSNLAKLVQQEAADWRAHMALVETWYNQFVKKDPIVQHYLADPSNPAQEQQLLVGMIEDIIFGQEAIQAFFVEEDLNWAAHKRIVKKLVHQGLASYEQNSEKEPNLKAFGPTAQGEGEQRFYADLVHTTLQKDKALETHIAQKSENWTGDRMMLLDKTIIKLALCEMIYFPSIPIKVSINEYIDIAKTYSIPKSSQFVNGLLDAVAATLQPGGTLTKPDCNLKR